MVNLCLLQSNIVECQYGYHGRNCSNICSTNCNVTSRCDKVSGKCIGGCKPGWFGDMCDQGTY